jgi:drug/metabolite transporter (DMT)-like permease
MAARRPASRLPAGHDAGAALAGGGRRFHRYIGRVFLYASIQHLGAMRASALKRLNPFFAVLLGVGVLGESLSGRAGWGVLLIVLSFAILIRSQWQSPRGEPAGVPLWRRL